MATYYVTKTGSDNNPGTEAEPWLTIDKASTVMVAGDTTYVKTGDYSGFTVPGIGNTENYIKYLAYPEHSPKVTQLYFGNGASYNKFDGFEITYPSGGGVEIIQNNDHNIISKCHIHHCNPSGSCAVDWANGSDYNIVEDCIIHDCYYAIHTSGTNSIGNIFRRNKCYNITDDGVNISPDASGTEIIDNIIYGCGDDGIHLFDNGAAKCTGNLVYDCSGIALWIDGAGGMVTKNNTIIGKTGAKWNILFYMGKANHEVKNNIFYVDDSLINLFNNEGSGVIDYNCWYNPSKPKIPEGTHGIAVDPKFVDPNNNDYTLQIDSPCIGTGEGGVDMGYTSETGEPPEPPEGVTEIKIDMTTGAGSISGDVTDADGVPIPGEAFALSNLPAGTYTITFIIRGTTVGYKYDVQNITVGE